MSNLIMPDQNELGDMLRYMRPAGSVAEKSFKEKFLSPLGMAWDAVGNGWLQITNSPILWSCHTDTVHYKSGRQDVLFSSMEKNRSVATSSGTCLGADCTTGVFIMMNMIRNRVPGMYIFHAAEEKGCLGSKHAARTYAKPLKTYKAAIAFDRKGYKDIVEYQHGARCCSTAFAKSLATILDRGYAPASGVYTDTAEYTDLIGECTNISVGYFNQHTANESQDVDFALWLAQRMCTVDFSGLTYSRKAGEYDSEYSNHYYGGGGSYGYRRREPRNIYDLCDLYPYKVSQLLQKLDIPFEELKTYCEAYTFQPSKVKATTK